MQNDHLLAVDNFTHIEKVLLTLMLKSERFHLVNIILKLMHGTGLKVPHLFPKAICILITIIGGGLSSKATLPFWNPMWLTFFRSFFTE